MSDPGPLFARLGSMLGSGEPIETISTDLWSRFGAELAVMVLDCCGFTRITRKLGIERYLAGLFEARELVMPVLKRHGCVGCRTEADNISAAFPDSPSALEAALASRILVRGRSIGRENGEDLRVSIGIGFGKVLYCPVCGAFGDEMNLASKLGEDIAGPDEILLTPAAWSALPAGRRELFTRASAEVSGIGMDYYRLDPRDCSSP
ncbi:adenylate/guanylate cyclase domain-containing protein [Candidatus Fermentibacterales bacterium]|nr:adenylate/guanylate cyclase domain-containing protein [Candidatus Fermentibacterales bacterium]